MKNLKSMKKLAFTAFALISFTTVACAQATATATASATITQPITITKDVDMNFGNVTVQAATGGTVVLAPDGTRTRTLGVTLPATTGTVTAAQFTVTGVAGWGYNITLPTSVTLNKGAFTMTANTFTSNPTGSGGVLTGGTEVVRVGATLNVAAGQDPGLYVSSTGFDVTVNYN